MSPNDQQKSYFKRPCILRSMSLSMKNIMPTPLSEMKWSPTSPFDAVVGKMVNNWQWSNEEVDFLQTILIEESIDLQI